MSNAATPNKRPRILIAMANWFSSRTCRRKHGFPREMPFDTWFKVRSEKYNSILTVFKCFSGPNVLGFVWLIMHRCATQFQFMGAHFTNMVAFCKYGRFRQIWKRRRLVTAPLNFIPTWGNKCREGSNTYKSYTSIHKYYKVSTVSVWHKNISRVNSRGQEGERSCSRTARAFWRETLQFNFKQKVWIHLSKKNIVQPCVTFSPVPLSRIVEITINKTKIIL